MMISNERGSALIITLMLLLILTAIGIYAISVSTTEMSNALQSKVGTSTFNAAEAAVHYGIDQIPKSEAFPPSNNPDNTVSQVTTAGTPNFTIMPGYGGNLRFQDFNVAGQGTAPSGFAGTRSIAAVVIYGPQPIGTMY